MDDEKFFLFVEPLYRLRVPPTPKPNIKLIVLIGTFQHYV